ncbi:hypothetical protein [Flavobacterium ardleyense]|uniref:hypothetical protein n=1 Tax=Flavobacterium ardleyense TaxID=2038737 RepID=UPI00298BD234|nr:hypothetical protein [Flavobacterium ardleyense]
MKKETHWVIKNFLWIFLITLIGLFSLQWYLLNKNINSLNEENKKQITRLENSKTNLIQLVEVEKDSLNYIFKAKDIEKINTNLNALASEIYQERNKAEAIIDKDIDRLNLYMALGIGFIALLGVFVPILVNVLSNDDLNKKQEVLDAKLIEVQTSISSIETKVKDLNKEELQLAISNANQALSKTEEITNLKNKTDDILPKLSVISLQIAIHRLFNVSSLSLSKTRAQSKELFKELFENIKSHLEYCQSDENLIIANSKIMKQTLIDFADLIDNESFKFTSYITTSRSINEKTLVKSLKDLSESDESNQSGKFTLVIKSFEKFIEQITNLNS